MLKRRKTTKELKNCSDLDGAYVARSIKATVIITPSLLTKLENITVSRSARLSYIWNVLKFCTLEPTKPRRPKRPSFAKFHNGTRGTSCRDRSKVARLIAYRCSVRFHSNSLLKRDNSALEYRSWTYQFQFRGFVNFQFSFACVYKRERKKERKKTDIRQNTRALHITSI